jgi:ribonuclease P protein component
MLSKKERVNKELFHKIFKSGGTIYSSLFSFKYLKNNENRHSFVVSKKISKKAVLRNKIRRQGYRALAQLPKNSYSGIFIFKNKASFDEIKKEIAFIFTKLK